MTRADLSALIRTTTTDLLVRRGIGVEALPAELDWASALTEPRATNSANSANGGHHEDYTTAIALRAAPALDLAPRQLATWLADSLADHPYIDAAAVAGPGFVDLYLAPEARGAVIAEVLGAADRYGEPFTPPPTRRPLEFDDVQYAHARLCSLARHAEALAVPVGVHYELLAQPSERSLVRTLAEFPRVVARNDATKLVRYLRRVTDAVHVFDTACRVLPMGDEPTSDVHGARLALCAAARQVLANGLGLLAVPAPERM